LSDSIFSGYSLKQPELVPRYQISVTYKQRFEILEYLMKYIVDHFKTDIP